MDWQQNGYSVNYQPCLEAITDGDSTSSLKMIKKLGEHPFFTISLKSNEWFHSGMIAWLIRKYHVFGDVFFPNACMGKCSDSDIIVETEKGHRDITIILDGDRYFVIENKFKSFYNNSQLEDYRQNLIIRPEDPDYDEYSPTQNRFKDGVVLGVMRRNGEPAVGWRYMSYYDILSGLKEKYDELKRGNKLTKLDSILISEYLQFLDSILSVLSSCLDNLGGAYWGDDNLLHSLDDVGLAEFVKAMIAHSFGEYFLSKYNHLANRKAHLHLDVPYTYGGEPCVVFHLNGQSGRSTRKVTLKLTWTRIVKTIEPKCTNDDWSGNETIKECTFDTLLEKVINNLESAEKKFF